MAFDQNPGDGGKILRFVLFFIGGLLMGVMITVASLFLWIRIQIRKINSHRRPTR
jgi:hypothetical protein